MSTKYLIVSCSNNYVLSTLYIINEKLVTCNWLVTYTQHTGYLR